MLIILEYSFTDVIVKSQYDKVISRAIPYCVSSGLTMSIINTVQLIASIWDVIVTLNGFEIAANVGLLMNVS